MSHSDHLFRWLDTTDHRSSCSDLSILYGSWKTLSGTPPKHPILQEPSQPWACRPNGWVSHLQDVPSFCLEDFKAPIQDVLACHDFRRYFVMWCACPERYLQTMAGAVAPKFHLTKHLIWPVILWIHKCQLRGGWHWLTGTQYSSADATFVWDQSLQPDQLTEIPQNCTESGSSFRWETGKFLVFLYMKAFVTLLLTIGRSVWL